MIAPTVQADPAPASGDLETPNTQYYLFILGLGAPICRLLVALIYRALRPFVNPQVPQTKVQKSAFLVLMALVSMGILCASFFCFGEFIAKWGERQSFSPHFQGLVNYATAVFAAFHIYHIIVLSSTERGLKFQFLMWSHHLVVIGTVAALQVGLVSYGFVFLYSVPTMVQMLADCAFIYYHLSFNIPGKIRMCSILQIVYVMIIVTSNSLFFTYLGVHYDQFTAREKCLFVTACVAAWLPEQINWIFVWSSIKDRLIKHLAASQDLEGSRPTSLASSFQSRKVYWNKTKERGSGIDIHQLAQDEAPAAPTGHTRLRFHKSESSTFLVAHSISDTTIAAHSQSESDVSTAKTIDAIIASSENPKAERTTKKGAPELAGRADGSAATLNDDIEATVHVPRSELLSEPGPAASADGASQIGRRASRSVSHSASDPLSITAQSFNSGSSPRGAVFSPRSA